MRYIVFILAALLLPGAVHAADTGTSGSLDENQAPAMEPGMVRPFAYSEWDSDDDDRLAEQEFYAGYEESGLFDQWDANDDGALTEDELGAGLYDTWDYDDDGYLDDDEVEEYGFWDW